MAFPTFDSKQAQSLLDQGGDYNHVYDAGYAADPAFKKNVDYMRSLPDLNPGDDPQNEDQFRRFAVMNQYFGNKDLPEVDHVTANIVKASTPAPQQTMPANAAQQYPKTFGGTMGFLGHELIPDALKPGNQITKQNAQNIEDSGNAMADIRQQYHNGQIGFGEALGKFASNWFGGAAKNVENTMSGFTPNFIKEGMGLVAKDTGIQGGIQSAAEEYSGWASKHPTAAAALEASGNFGRLVVDALGAKGMMEGGQNMYESYDKAVQPSAENLQGQLKKTVGQITQGKTPEEIAQGTKALQNPSLDTSGVKTYEDLQNAVKKTTGDLSTQQDQYLSQFPDKHPLEEFDTTVGKGKNAVTSNSVSDAMDHLSEYYTKTGKYADAARIQSLQETAAKEGLDVKQMNDLAKEYGAQRSGFSPKTGEQLTSVNPQLYENTRTALKNDLRGTLPDETSKAIDLQIHDNMGLQDMVDEVTPKVQGLQNKIQERGLFEAIARKVGKTMDAAALHTPSGFINSFIKGNVGLKQMNFLEIQNALRGNLSKVTDLLSQIDSMSDAKATNAIADLFKGMEKATGGSLPANALSSQKSQ